MVAAVLGAAASVAAAQTAPYADVPSDAQYAGPVNTLAADGVFVGTECDEGFCPGEAIDRATMAVWTVRVLDGADPAPVASTRFADVDATHPHAEFIERLAELGVTNGCGDGTTFCPDRTVTRAQVAAVLSRAFNLAEGPDPGFSDVASDAWYAADVAKLAASGVTTGCGDATMFCPNLDVTRAQMATFLARALGASEEDTGGGDNGNNGGSTGESGTQQQSGNQQSNLQEYVVDPETEDPPPVSQQQVEGPDSEDSPPVSQQQVIEPTTEDPPPVSQQQVIEPTTEDPPPVSQQQVIEPTTEDPPPVTDSAWFFSPGPWD